MREIRGKFSSPALIHRRMNSSSNLDESSFAGRREDVGMETWRVDRREESNIEKGNVYGIGK